MTNQVKIKITGKNPNTFLNELILEKINIYDLEKDNNSLMIRVSISDYKKIIKKKTIYKINTIKYYGLSRIKQICKRYLIVILIWLLGIILNYILGSFIWKVEINNSNQKLLKTISKDLKEYKISPFHKKVTYHQKEKIKRKILEKEKDLVEWLEIEEQGSKYIIKIEERKKNKKEAECLPRNIVAKKNSIILEIEAASGEIVKKKNDYVSSGETIISGWIYNKDQVMAKKCAIGKVYGETWYKVSITVPKEVIREKKTGKKKKGISLKLLAKKYDFLNKFRTYQKKEYNIIKEEFLPFDFSYVKYYETEKYKEKQSLLKAEKLAIKKSFQKIKQRLKKDEKILKKKVLKKTTNNSKIIIEVFYKIKENITSYQDINKIPIEEMNNKEE